MVARFARSALGVPANAEDYEVVLGPVYAWLDAFAQTGRKTGQGASVAAWRALGQGDCARGGPRRRALRAAFPAIVSGLNRLGLGPLSDDLSIHALRESSLRAIARSCWRCGSTRRSWSSVTPTEPGRCPATTRPGGGHRIRDAAPELRLLGRERTLAGSDRRSPYRPGFCVRLNDDGDPELVNLLD